MKHTWLTIGAAVLALSLAGCLDGGHDPGDDSGSEPVPVFTKQAPLPHGQGLEVCVRGETLFGASPVFGADFFKSLDGGASWNKLASFPQREINVVVCPTADSLFAFGNANVIFKSVDGGATWTEQADLLTGTGAKYFTAAHFQGSRKGWMASVKHTILRTTDGGSTWTASPAGTEDLYGLFFTDSAVGYAVGDEGAILKTTDGGGSWNPRPSGVTAALRKVHFPQRDTGFAVGLEGTVLRTTNAGATWTVSLKQDTAWIYRLHFFDGRNGIVGGSYLPPRLGVGTWEIPPPRPAIWRTADAGATWTRMLFEGAGGISDIEFASRETGYLFGDGGQILKTTNGGADWAWLSSGPGIWGNFSFPTEKTGYGVSVTGGITKTTDGKTWIGQYSGISYAVKGVSFADTNAGYAAGEYGTILRTTDGGARWTISAGIAVNINWDNGTLYSVAAPEASTAYAVGDGGRILFTVDGGAHWDQPPSGTTQALLSVAFQNTAQGSAVGANGTIRTTFNGGLSWFPGTHNAGNLALLSVTFPAPSIGYAVGDSGVILKTTDAGATWKRQKSGSTRLLVSVSFADANRGWVAEDGDGWEFEPEPGRILATTNGGKTWTPLAGLPASVNPHSLHYQGNGRGYIGTLSGEIYRAEPAAD